MDKILVVPNPLLRKKAFPLDNINNSEIKLSKKMINIMLNAPGLGLAAPQLGYLKRIITINTGGEENNKNPPYALFNPEIVWYSEKKVLMEEGCLSIPEQYAEIQRPEKIIIKYFDSKNKVRKKKTEGLEARIIQHEVDHLDGKLFIDYLSPLKRNIIIKKVQKLKKIKKI